MSTSLMLVLHKPFCEVAMQAIPANAHDWGFYECATPPNETRSKVVHCSHTVTRWSQNCNSFDFSLLKSVLELFLLLLYECQRGLN